jgi:WD40 repeat protein
MNADGSARVWEAQSGKPVSEVMEHGHLTSAKSAEFSYDGRFIVTAGGSSSPSGGLVRIWDAESGKPLSEPLLHPSQVKSARFSPDGKRVVTVDTESFQEAARVWDIMPAGRHLPNWLQPLAEAVAGQHLSERSGFEPLNKDSSEILQEVKDQLNHESPDNDWVTWGRWFLADRSTRTISPFSKITVPEYIENRIKENTADSLDEAEQLAVGNSQLLQRIQQAREGLKKNDEEPTQR